MKLTKEISIYLAKRYRLWLKAKRKKWAINLANDQHRATGRCFVVIELGNHFHVVDNRTRKSMNKHNSKYSRISWVEMMQNAVYSTK